MLRQSTGVRFGKTGLMELMAARDARLEACDIEGGTGSDTATHKIEWRIERAPSPAQAARAAQVFNRPLVLKQVPDGGGKPPLATEPSLISIEGDALITALKPADRGTGLIVRALLVPGPATLHFAPALQGQKLKLVDAAERDLRDLGTVSESLTLDRAKLGALVSLRIQMP